MAYQPKLAYIITTFIQAMAYGMNIISFVACIRTLLMFGGQSRPKHDIHWLMVGAALAMFGISTADAIIEVHFVVALFYLMDPRASLELVGDFHWWSITSFCFYFIQTWLGDSVLIYRCYIVWNKRFAIVAVPIMTSFAALVFGISAAIVGSLQPGSSARRKNLTPLIITFYVMALTTNLITTSLIVRRIWGVRRGTSKYRTYPSTFRKDDPLSRAIMVTIEAGLVYTISLLALVVIYLIIHTSQFAVQRIVVQMIGITFNLIIVQSQRGDDNPRDSASFKRFSPIQMMITNDVVVSRDPPPRQESNIGQIERGPDDTEKREDVRISWCR